MQYEQGRSSQFKAILLGECGVGKTSLFQRFRSKDIPSTPKSALLLDKYQHSRQFTVGPGGNPIEFQLWDTANMERVHSLTESYFRETSAILLVYDIADAVSLRRFSYWREELKYHLPYLQNRVFLIGNKTDLEIAKYDSAHTTVSYAKNVIGKQCVDITDVFEVSAKDGFCVERMFQSVAEYLWKWYVTENGEPSNNGGSSLGQDSIKRNDSIRLHEESTKRATDVQQRACCSL